MFLNPLSPEIATARLMEFKEKFPRQALASNGRAERAVSIATSPEHIKPIEGDPGRYLVCSESNSAGVYIVDVKAKSCTCPDHGKHSAEGAVCKHRLAVAYLTAFGKETPTMAPEPSQAAAPAESTENKIIELLTGTNPAQETPASQLTPAHPFQSQPEPEPAPILDAPDLAKAAAAFALLPEAKREQYYSSRFNSFDLFLVEYHTFKSTGKQERREAAKDLLTNFFQINAIIGDKPGGETYIDFLNFFMLA